MKGRKITLVAGIVAGVTIALVALFGFVLGPQVAFADPGEPVPGAVSGIATYTFYPQTQVITGDGLLGTVYSASPRTVFGIDVSRTRFWHSADAFITVDVLAGSQATVTAQLSNDASNWAEATYSWPEADSREAANHFLNFSADDTGYLRLPLAGEYLRFMLEYSGTVTTTINVTLRND